MGEAIPADGLSCIGSGAKTLLQIAVCALPLRIRFRKAMLRMVQPATVDDCLLDDCTCPIRRMSSTSP